MVAGSAIGAPEYGVEATPAAGLAIAAVRTSRAVAAGVELSTDAGAPFVSTVVVAAPPQAATSAVAPASAQRLSTPWNFIVFPLSGLGAPLTAQWVTAFTFKAAV